MNNNEVGILIFQSRERLKTDSYLNLFQLINVTITFNLEMDSKLIATARR